MVDPGRKIKLLDMDGNWKKMEERDNPIIFKVIQQLKGDLKALRNMIEEENTPIQQLR